MQRLELDHEVPVAPLKGKHPRGLYVLFGTEMWERLSYYGMRAILVLYMVAPASAGGLGFSNARAAGIYGTYTSSVYLTPLLGGWLADRFFGARLAVLIGGIIIALGHFSLVFHSMTYFYAGLVLITLGTGLLKPNISALVGNLYLSDDPRRDAGFSIFYMGINLGAFLAPLVCGTLAQAPVFKTWLLANGFDPVGSWHWGFAAAGVGMTLGLAQFIAQRRHLLHVGSRPEKSPAGSMAALQPKLTAIEVRRIAVIGILFFFAALFWMAFEQAGSSMSLFADQLTDNSIFGFSFPSSWFQAANPIFIIMLAPIFAKFWIGLGKRQPSSPAKFSCGLLFAGLGFVVLFYASTLTGGGLVSPFWLTLVYLLHTIGELCLSPIGLSTVTKLAPLRIVGLMMGVWFLATSVGNYAAGWIAGLFQAESKETLFTIFGALAVLTIVPAGVLAFIVKPIRKLMGGVH